MTEARAPVALVTGASGAIGRVLCARLCAEGWRVIGISTRDVGAGPWQLHLAADLSDPQSVCIGDRLAGEGVTVVWHLAGKAHALSELGQDPAAYGRVNTDGTRNALAIAFQIGARRFVFASSVKAMGEGGTVPSDETALCEPQSPYGRSKLAAEQLVLAASKHMEPVVLRFCMVYGAANERGNMARMLEAVRRRRFPPFPETGNRRSFLHVNDAVQACWLAGTHKAAPQGVFLVTDGRPRSTAELFAAMCKALGRRVPRLVLPVLFFRAVARVGDVCGMVVGRRAPLDSASLAKLLESAIYSSEKISRTLGYRPAWPLERGIAAMVHPSRAKETGS